MKVLEFSKLDTKRKPIVTLDENLDSFKDVIPCQAKIDAANHMLQNNNFFEKMGSKEHIQRPNQKM